MSKKEIREIRIRYAKVSLKVIYRIIKRRQQLVELVL